MRDDPSVVALVLRAADGDQQAWDEIVERYAPLVYAICTRYRLGSHDIEDVGQTVWLLLVEHLGQLREPAALPGWLATTTAHECLRVVKAAGRQEWRGAGEDDRRATFGEVNTCQGPPCSRLARRRSATCARATSDRLSRLLGWLLRLSAWEDIHVDTRGQVADGTPRGGGYQGRRIRSTQRISVRDEATRQVARGGSRDHSPRRRCDRQGADSSGPTDPDL